MSNPISGLKSIGIGGRDFKPEIGGLMADLAYRTLCDDPHTSTLVVVAKPAEPELLAALLKQWSAISRKRTVLCFVGFKESEREWIMEQLDAESRELFIWASTLMEAGALAVAADQGRDLSQPSGIQGDTAGQPSVLAADEIRLGAQQRYIRGLYCGGTLCYEAVAEPSFSKAGRKLWSRRSNWCSAEKSASSPTTAWVRSDQ